MKKLVFVCMMLCTMLSASRAQGWPANYDGVMLQGFYWDSYHDTQWKNLESQADELARYFGLVWVPQSGYCGDSNNMGYMPYYYFNQNSSFGSESQLRSMISTFKAKGLGVIADVVINHRNTNGWFDFPSETYKGVTYQMKSTDICSNDDGGSTKTEATKQGVSLSSNADTGEDWSGCRDIDHKSSNVNTCVKAYLNYLLNDLGYAGFRYDMVKGYSASFTADYNSTVKPAYSVGEYWDNSSSIKSWINGTKVNGVPQSAAFDFQFRYRVRDAINNADWTQLALVNMNASATPLAYETDYQQYAVTFVENHDTEYRSSSSPQDPIKKDTLAANAFLLAMPGTPCVFLTHWKAEKKQLKMMIEARRLAGLSNTQCTYKQLSSNKNYFAFKTTGSKGTLLCVVGSQPDAYTNLSGFRLICSGNKYRYYINSEAYGDWDATVARINEEEKEEPFTPHTATIYVRTDESLSWSRMNFYIWDSNNNTQLNGNWPGKQMSDTKVIEGKTWYYQTFDITSANYYFNAVFSTSTGSPQTVDVTDITEDAYFVIGPGKSGSKYLVNDVTEDMTGVAPVVDSRSLDNRTFDLSGRQIPVGTAQKGLYIRNGKKYLVR